MATIILRIAKGSPLSNQEADNNINNLNDELITKLPSASYTANDVLAKLLTVDGAGSGLDADLLDGLSSSSTLPVVANKSSVVTRDSSGNFTANNITATVSNANALSGVTSNGFIARISVGNHIARAITGSGSDIIVNNGDGISGNPVISAGTNLARLDSTNSYALPQSFVMITANALSNDGNNNLFTGANNLSNASTNGFVYIPNITGTPTGVPTTNVGRTPLVWDASANILWVYSGGTWNPSNIIGDNTITNAKYQNTSITPNKLSTGAPTWDTSGVLYAARLNSTDTNRFSKVITDGAANLFTNGQLEIIGLNASRASIGWHVSGVGARTIHLDTDGIFRTIDIGGTTQRVFHGAAGGAAPVFACRAWVNFNGFNSVINASGNVSSISKTGAGFYIINFITPMQDALSSVSSSCSWVNDGTSGTFLSVRSIQPSFVSIGIVSQGANRDVDQITISVFR